jgi:hypothetical protein
MMSITYANDRSSDGAGAQLHRIIGVIALAEALQVAYDHSPLLKMDYHGWDLYLQNEHDAELPQKWDRFLGFPAAAQEPPTASRVWDTVSPDQLPAIREWLQEGGQARIVLPFPFLDTFPHYLERVRPRLLNWYDRTPKPNRERPEALQVALHVRRGELHLWESNRILPNAYYLAVIRELRKHLHGNVEFHVHSEGNATSGTGSEEVFRSAEYADHMREESKNLRRDRDHFEDFTKEGCILHINEDIFQTFHRCVTADIYVMSKSSLSYVMGAYAKGVVVYQPFWHKPLPSWCVVPLWRGIHSLKDLFVSGPRIMMAKLLPGKVKGWEQLRDACLLRRAQRIGSTGA